MKGISDKAQNSTKYPEDFYSSKKKNKNKKNRFTIEEYSRKTKNRHKKGDLLIQVNKSENSRKNKDYWTKKINQQYTGGI